MKERHHKWADCPETIFKKMCIRDRYNNAARFRLEVTEENPRAAALYHILGFEDLPYQQMVMDTPALD